jgi:hypothetical protein
VQALYQTVYDTLGSDTLWDLVATASLYPGGADLNAANGYLQEQYKENIGSLDRARQSWHSGNWRLASAQVQQGGPINPHYQTTVWQLYRACIRDQRDAFFAIIDSILT